MSRAAVWSLVTQDSVIQGMGYSGASNIYGNNVIDKERRGGPFIVLVWGDVTRPRATDRDSTLQVQDLRVWAHQSKYDTNDYRLINEVLERVKVLFASAVHLPGSDGRVVSRIDWLGDSADLADEVLNTITRNASFQVAHRKAN